MSVTCTYCGDTVTGYHCPSCGRSPVAEAQRRRRAEEEREYQQEIRHRRQYYACSVCGSQCHTSDRCPW